MADKTDAPYSVYILLCKGNVLYTGIAKDVVTRFEKHQAGKGAKFTKSHPPIKVMAHKVVGSKSNALKIEYVIKQMPRPKKLAYLRTLDESSFLEEKV